MEPPRPRKPHARPRRGSLERPVNARSVRGTLLLVALPLLVCAFTLARPDPLPAPDLPAVFDVGTAAELATQLASENPDRSPGSPGAAGAARWFRQQLGLYGFDARVDRWNQHVPGKGVVPLENLVVAVPGRTSDAIVVMANRDNTGTGPGANDNASGTAALVELLRAYATPAGSQAPARPEHTLLFVSTDGGAYGALGANRFAATSPYRNRVVAAFSLRALASAAKPRLEIAADAPRSPSAALARTAATRVLEQTGDEPGRPRALRQLIDLGFPLTLGEQGPFLARGIPALTLTTAGDRPERGFTDTADVLTEPAAVRRYEQLGRAAQNLLLSLDASLDVGRADSTYVYLGRALVRGWAVELVLLFLLVPYLVGAVDLFARCRRRRIPLAPAMRSLRSRLAFWAYAGVVVLLASFAGLFPRGDARPLPPDGPGAPDWSVLGWAVLGVLLAAGWLVSRERLLPRRNIVAAERLAGYSVALLALGVVALTVAAINPFALLFLVPSLYAWLWLPQLHESSRTARWALYAVGFAGPLLPIVSIADRFGIGLDAIQYTFDLFTVGYAAPVTIAVLLGWAATAGQLGALVSGRYAPYPDAKERGPRGPLREVVHRAVLSLRRRRHALRPVPAEEVLEGPG
jgi:Peptidase family M28